MAFSESGRLQSIGTGFPQSAEPSPTIACAVQILMAPGRLKVMTSTIDAPDWSSIPAPVDDGAAKHLFGARMASVSLAATDGATVDLSALKGRTVVYAYPRTGRPGVENPDGWDMIPGARGCTPQSCSFRDHF